MSDANAMAEARARMLAAGANKDDLAWLDAMGWNDSNAPKVRGEADLADLKRREAMLNAAVAHLSFAERAASPEGKLAAALGARIADWSDRGEADE